MIKILCVLLSVLATACGSKPGAGSEGGACYGNGTCNEGLACLSKLCVRASQSSAAPSSVEAGKPSGAPVARPPTTAVILDDYDGAAVLACSISDKLVESAWVCSQEIKGDLTVGSLGGGQRRLGAPKTLKCDPMEDGDVREKRAGFAIDKGPTADEDLLGQFLIWPASRTRDAILWNTRPTVDIVGLTRRAAEISKSLTFNGGEGGTKIPYVMTGAIDVRGALTADIDGDDKPDVIYSIALPSDEEPFWQPRYLLASVSVCAQRPRASKRRRGDVAAGGRGARVMCSTPEGIEAASSPRTRPRCATTSPGAQRPRASKRRRVRCLRHEQPDVALCSTPEGIEAASSMHPSCQNVGFSIGAQRPRASKRRREPRAGVPLLHSISVLNARGHRSGVEGRIRGE